MAVLPKQTANQLELREATLVINLDSESMYQLRNGVQPTAIRKLLRQARETNPSSQTADRLRTLFQVVPREANLTRMDLMRQVSPPMRRIRFSPRRSRTNGGELLLLMTSRQTPRPENTQRNLPGARP